MRDEGVADAARGNDRSSWEQDKKPKQAVMSERRSSSSGRRPSIERAQSDELIKPAWAAFLAASLSALMRSASFFRGSGRSSSSSILSKRALDAAANKRWAAFFEKVAGAFGSKVYLSRFCLLSLAPAPPPQLGLPGGGLAGFATIAVAAGAVAECGRLALAA